MPLINKTTYPGSPFWLINGHFQTIIPGFEDKKGLMPYQRERFKLEDEDFIDLDWIRQGADKLVLLIHGLEGNSQRIYVRKMAQFFADKQWNVLAWNARSCSGEMNHAFRLYEHGEIGDLTEVIQTLGEYKQIVLIGFSMGGSIVLNYLGRIGDALPPNVTHGIAISTPCNLGDCADKLDQKSNFLYKNKFKRKLTAKITRKAAQYPGKIDLSKMEEVTCWRDIDEFYSAPINGYQDADDFYAQASAGHFVHGVTIPTLLINSTNDPILTPSCSPIEIARKHPKFYLELTTSGGHVSFPTTKKQGYWLGNRILSFVFS